MAPKSKRSQLPAQAGVESTLLRTERGVAAAAAADRAAAAAFVVADTAELDSVLKRHLLKYEMFSGKRGKFVLTPSVKHVLLGLARDFLGPIEHCNQTLLVGPRGSGRRSVARFAGFICGLETFEISLCDCSIISVLHPGIQAM